MDINIHLFIHQDNNLEKKLDKVLELFAKLPELSSRLDASTKDLDKAVKETSGT